MDNITSLRIFIRKVEPSHHLKFLAVGIKKYDLAYQVSCISVKQIFLGLNDRRIASFTPLARKCLHTANLGGSPGLVVMGGDSRSKGRGFESRHRILDGHFSHIVKIVMFV